MPHRQRRPTNAIPADPTRAMRDRLAEMRRRALAAARPRVYGRVCQALGLEIEVEGVEAALGDTLVIHSTTGPLRAEVIALRGPRLVCAPLGVAQGIRYGSSVEATGEALSIEVGDGLLGRVLDGFGRPLDGRPLPAGLETVSIEQSSPHPLRRRPVERQVALGIRAIDTLTPCGEGQRLGIFAGSGVGKSTLLGMIARGSSADVAVVALVGERGREVAEFIDHDLGSLGLARSVVVVATSDSPALLRIKAAFVATRIAEYFRDKGAAVVLMMDSLTRLAMAQREVGLAAGEPPATRGYPPSTFGLLPRLLERAGNSEKGSITGLYTVLVEGDDMDEPIADAARSILDGHIVLSRRLATSGHFPAIDVLESVSRLAPAIQSPDQATMAQRFRRLLAARRDIADLVEIGAYAPGSNPLADQALALSAEMESFLRQDLGELVSLEQSWAQLAELLSKTEVG